MKYSILTIFSLFNFSLFGQVKFSNIAIKDLPSSIKYSGRVINAVSWEDSLGLNYVITTETGNTERNKEGYYNAKLYAQHYVMNADSAKLLWRVYDYEADCGLDLDFGFIQKAFAITDLDKNNIAEVWVMYQNSCHGDISPVSMKIIMYEGTKKYALRGESKLNLGNEYGGGGFQLDNNFKHGNILFRQYAENLWKKYGKTSY